MNNMEKKEIREYSGLLMMPVFIAQDEKLLPMNALAEKLPVVYQEVAQHLPENDEELSSSPFVVHQEETAEFYAISGKKIIYKGKHAWLVALTPSSSGNTLQELFRISTARQIMFNTANEINHLETDQDVYEFILTNCGKAVECSDLCSLMLVEGDTTRIVAKRGYGSDVYSVSFELNKTFLGRATNGKFDRTVVINDLSSFKNLYHTEIRTQKDSQLLGSTLSAPVYVKGKLFVILCFDSVKKNAFTQNDVELLDVIKTNIEMMLTNHQMQMEILRLSKTDMLTGLYNRTYLKEYQTKHDQERFYVGMLDMNDLKGINDGHGHSSGDFMIRSMAKALQRTFPKDCVLFRLGGDEFLYLIYNMEEEEIRNRITALRTQLNQAPLRLADETWTSLSFSCGFALHNPGDDFDTVLSNADHLMYEEKRRIKALRFK